MELRYYNLSPGAITQGELIFAAADVVVDYLAPALALWQARLAALRVDCDAAYSPAGAPSLMKMLIDANKSISLADNIKNAFRTLGNGTNASTYTENTFVNGSDAGGFTQDALDMNIALQYVLEGYLDTQVPLPPPNWINTWNQVNAAAAIAWPDYGTLRQVIGQYITFSGWAAGK